MISTFSPGYIDYVWQWKDDPLRLEPKESYVKGFTPWGWVIGTGIYIDDVNAEIARIEQRLINIALAISGAVIVLLLFGTKRLKGIGSDLGNAIKGFRSAMSDPDKEAEEALSLIHISEPTRPY